MDIEARRANAQSSTRSQSQSQTSQSQTLSITPSATGSRTAASLTPIPLSALSIPNTPISVGMGVGMGGIMGAGAGMGMDELTPSSMLSGGEAWRCARDDGWGHDGDGIRQRTSPGCVPGTPLQRRTGGVVSTVILDSAVEVRIQVSGMGQIQT